MATCTPYDVVLVTGANGMVGRCVRDYVEAANVATDGRRWVFPDSKDADLRDRGAVEALFEKHNPTQVLHCAARLASASDMTARPVDFWMDNVQINNNVLRAAHAFNAKVVSVLSTVMFSKDATFPVQGTPENIFGGQLHEISQSYGFSKRALAHFSQWYRKQHDCRFSCILPSNIFGPYGAFETKAAPLLNALIAKAESSLKSGTAMTVMGTGVPMRQMLYARDLARILVWALDNFDDGVPLIVAGDEVAVRDLAKMACDAVGCTSGLQFDLACPDGPLRRTADISRFARLCPEHKPTPLNEAIQETAQWYLVDKSGRNIADAVHVRDQV